MRIAWFSPLNRPAVLRSAYLSQQLLLSDVAWDVEIFSGDQDIAAQEAKKQTYKIPTYHFHRFWQRHALKPFDICVYHLEDDAEARFVERAMRLWPGICFFHDTSLNNLSMSRFSHSTAGSDIDEFVVAACGEDAPPIGSWKIRGWSIESFLRQLELAADVLALPLHAIVPSVAAADALETRTTVFPLPLGELAIVTNPERNDSSVRIGFSGSTLLDDRIATILDALQGIIGVVQTVSAEWILPAAHELQFAQKMLEKLPHKVAQNITLTVVAETQQLAEVVASCDVWIGLSAALSHAIDLPTMTALALKLPVIGSTAQQWEEVPPQCFLPVTLGRGETKELELLLKELCSSSALREQCRQESKVELVSRTEYFALLSALFAQHLAVSQQVLSKKQAEYRNAAAELQAATEQSLEANFDNERRDGVSSFFRGM